jgi:hypothetical protein
MTEFRENAKNSERMEKCPLFDDCAAPRCPLDTNCEQRIYYSGEPKCTSEKYIRYFIGKDMEHCGMTSKEWDGYKRFYSSDIEIRKRLKEEFGHS